MLDGPVQEGWVVEAIRQALAVPGTRLGAIALVRNSATRGLAWRLHRFVDVLDQKIRCRSDRLFAPVDVPDALGWARSLEIPMVRDGARWELGSTAVSLLRDARVDVWLWFCPSAPRSPLPPVSRFGVWGLEIGARVPAASPWAAAAEVGARSDLTLAQVVDYTQPGRNVVYRACGATIKNSARRNRLLALRKGVSFFARLLRNATTETIGRGRLQAMEPVPLAAARPAPTARAVLRLSWRLAAQVILNQARGMVWRQQWRIGYYYAEDADAVYSSSQLRCLVPPRDRDWADPFIVHHAGRDFIFFEELPYKMGRACISAVEVFENGESGPPMKILERPYHLSYPFVFHWKGELYMLPETAGNRTVELYRCEQFPDRWRLERVLLEGLNAFDATLLRDGGRWWMFVNVAEPGADPSEELHIYFSESPLGPWLPHAGNPVVSDVRHARGAGPLFRRDGVLFRPSQDCSSTYGSAVCINRIDVLDPENYQETPVGRIDPDRRAAMRCLHTFGAAGRLRVVDYLVRRPRWSRT